MRSNYLKVEIELVSWPVFDYLAITPNLILHYKNFSVKQPTETPVDKLTTKLVGGDSELMDFDAPSERESLDFASEQTFS